MRIISLISIIGITTIPQVGSSEVRRHDGGEATRYRKPPVGF
jgi:hypothetical protein